MEGKTKPCLRFAEDELTDPRLEKPIRKADRAAAKADTGNCRKFFFCICMRLKIWTQHGGSDRITSNLADEKNAAKIGWKPK